MNIVVFFLWSSRLFLSHKKYKFIESRLERISLPDVPKFRVVSKESDKELAKYVRNHLIWCFIKNYLEPDGYFFILMLRANVSDFVVQEVIEQLWKKYVFAYGQNDAKQAELKYEQRKSKKGSSQTGKSSKTHTAQETFSLLDRPTSV
jgi:hypothetical protein